MKWVQQAFGKPWLKESMKMFWDNAKIIMVMNGLTDSLLPIVSIWRDGSESALAQVMVCCPTTPSHYLSQTFSYHRMYSGAFTWDQIHKTFSRIFFITCVRILHFKISTTFSMANELNCLFINEHQFSWETVSYCAVQSFIKALAECLVLLQWCRWHSGKMTAVNVPIQP